jgi:hypothetical protein
LQITVKGYPVRRVSFYLTVFRVHDILDFNDDAGIGGGVHGYYYVGRKHSGASGRIRD